jgi:hypothetical protein
MPVATLWKLLLMGMLKPVTPVHPPRKAGSPESISIVIQFPTALKEAAVAARIGLPNAVCPVTVPEYPLAFAKVISEAVGVPVVA